MKHQLLLDIVSTLLDPTLHWSEVLITSGQPLKFNTPSGPAFCLRCRTPVTEGRSGTWSPSSITLVLAQVRMQTVICLPCATDSPIGMAMLDDPVALAARAGLLHTAQEVDLVTTGGETMPVRLRFAVVVHGKTDRPSYRIACRSQRIAPPHLMHWA